MADTKINAPKEKGMNKVSYEIVAVIEGDLDYVMRKPKVDVPDMRAVLDSLNELAFIAETVAHLMGRETTLLPAAERARAIIKKLEG